MKKLFLTFIILFATFAYAKFTEYDPKTKTAFFVDKGRYENPFDGEYDIFVQFDVYGRWHLDTFWGEPINYMDYYYKITSVNIIKKGAGNGHYYVVSSRNYPDIRHLVRLSEIKVMVNSTGNFLLYNMIIDGGVGSYSLPDDQMVFWNSIPDIKKMYKNESLDIYRSFNVKGSGERGKIFTEHYSGGQSVPFRNEPFEYKYDILTNKSPQENIQTLRKILREKEFETRIVDAKVDTSLLKDWYELYHASGEYYGNPNYISLDGVKPSDFMQIPDYKAYMKKDFQKQENDRSYRIKKVRKAEFKPSDDAKGITISDYCKNNEECTKYAKDIPSWNEIRHKVSNNTFSTQKEKEGIRELSRRIMVSNKDKTRLFDITDSFKQFDTIKVNYKGNEYQCLLYQIESTNMPIITMKYTCKKGKFDLVYENYLNFETMQIINSEPVYMKYGYDEKIDIFGDWVSRYRNVNQKVHSDITIDGWYLTSKNPRFFENGKLYFENINGDAWYPSIKYMNYSWRAGMYAVRDFIFLIVEQDIYIIHPASKQIKKRTSNDYKSYIKNDNRYDYNLYAHAYLEDMMKAVRQNKSDIYDDFHIKQSVEYNPFSDNTETFKSAEYNEKNFEKFYESLGIKAPKKESDISEQELKQIKENIEEDFPGKKESIPSAEVPIKKEIFDSHDKVDTHSIGNMEDLFGD